MGDHDLAYIGFEEQSEVSGSLILNMHRQRISYNTIHRCQARFFRDFLLPRQPTSSTFVSKEYFFDDSVTQLPPISSELHQVIHARVRENHVGRERVVYLHFIDSDGDRLSQRSNRYSNRYGMLNFKADFPCTELGPSFSRTLASSLG